VEPQVSAIITTWNQAPYIGAAVQSVLSQTRPPDEVVVVDDGSTDDTAAQLASYSSRIRIVRQPNQGVAASRNRGVREARGDLLAFLDGNDLWEPDKLAVQLAAARENPTAGLVVVDGVIFDEGGVVGDHLFGGPVRDLIAAAGSAARARCYEYFLTSKLIATTSQVMMPAGVLAPVGPSDPTFPLASDYDLYLRVAARYDVAWVDRKLARWRYVPTSASGPAPQRPLRWAVDLLDIWKKHGVLAQPNHARRLREQGRALIRRMSPGAYEYGRRADRRWASRYLLGLWRRSPASVAPLIFLLALLGPEAGVSRLARLLRRAAPRAG